MFSHILRMVEVSGNGLHNVILKITLGQSAWNMLIIQAMYTCLRILWLAMSFEFIDCFTSGP